MMEGLIGDVLLQKIFRKTVEEADQIPNWIGKILITKDPFSIQAKQYCRYISDTYNSMRVIGMDKPVSLADIYINVNIRDKIPIHHNLLEFSEDNSFIEYEERTVLAKSVIAKNSRILVLGRPGAGKTTLLKYLAISSLDNRLSQNLVPIFISLKEWSADSKINLETAVIRQFDVCDLKNHAKEFVRILLRRGRCLLLFDGFDEVDEDYRTSAINQIEGFIKDFPKNKYVLSIRKSAVSYVFSEFTEVEIADFNDNQIKVFIRKWFSKKRIAAEKCITDLDDESNDGIKDLASNPLLLTLICIAFQESYSFPENRADLYEVALEALLKKWDASRDIIRSNPYKNLTLRKKEMLLCKIAAIGFEEDVNYYKFKYISRIIEAFVIEIIGDEICYDSKDLLMSLEAQHGIIIKEQTDEYRFSHLTFQEYYTAKYINENGNPDLLNKVVSKYCGIAGWNEVFLIYCGMQSNPESFLNMWKNQLDDFRNSLSYPLIDTAIKNIRFKSKYPEEMCIVLSMHRVMTYTKENDNFDTGESYGTELLLEQIAKKLAKALNLNINVSSAAISVTSTGMTKNNDEMNGLVAVMLAVTIGDSIATSYYQTIKYLTALYLLVSCLSGDALIRPAYKKEMLSMLFKDGHPMCIKSDNGSLFQ